MAYPGLPMVNILLVLILVEIFLFGMLKSANKFVSILEIVQCIELIGIKLIMNK